MTREKTPTEERKKIRLVDFKKRKKARDVSFKAMSQWGRKKKERKKVNIEVGRHHIIVLV